ncbi:hypothetical protein M1M15_gp14 [Vibrio phage XacF13]|uniref:Uncharacterized protein n=1 Tax=Vibrio phage XacF13 TaxID=3071318 RepID=A0A5P8FRT4_9VIRU|nr:hypothetical protein M1M15_gp14 [Vibrio phage XacF13]QFQ33311.1 hypothetical protein XaF13_p14 [Vibrio phage XacF13]
MVNETAGDRSPGHATPPPVWEAPKPQPVRLRAPARQRQESTPEDPPSLAGDLKRPVGRHRDSQPRAAGGKPRARSSLSLTAPPAWGVRGALA